MTEADEAYNDPIRGVFQSTLRDPEGEKAQLLNRLQELTVNLIEVVAQGGGVEDTRNRLNQGLEEYTQKSIQAIESAQETGRQKMEDAHRAGYEEAASVAGASSVPDWSPDASGVNPYAKADFDGNIRTFVRAGIEKEIEYFKSDLPYLRKYLSEDDFARAVGQVLAQGDEGIKAALRERGIDLDDFDTGSFVDEAADIFQNTKRIGSPSVRGVLEEIDSVELAQRNPQLYRRIKRNGTDSISRILDEVSKDLAVQSPAVDLVQWTLSSRHDGLRSSPDECDFLSEQDLYGFGQGRYHPSTCPSHPHPSCECSIRVVTRDPDDWGEEQRDRPDAFNVTEDQVRAQLKDLERESGRTVTDRHVERVTEQVRSVISQVHENPRG